MRIVDGELVEVTNDDLDFPQGSFTIPDGVTSIGNSAFADCSGLTSITIPYGVTSIGSRAFLSCSGLISITIPYGVTSIGNFAFFGCSGLTSITIPDGVTSIGSGVFLSCSGLTSVTIPDGVTSVGIGAFMFCSRLTSVTIPDGVTSIGNNAFNGCDSLENIIIQTGDDNEFWRIKLLLPDELQEKINKQIMEFRNCLATLAQGCVDRNSSLDECGFPKELMKAMIIPSLASKYCLPPGERNTMLDRFEDFRNFAENSEKKTAVKVPGPNF